MAEQASAGPKQADPHESMTTRTVAVRALPEGVEQIRSDVRNPAEPGEELVHILTDSMKPLSAVAFGEPLPDLTEEEYKSLLDHARSRAEPRASLINLLRKYGNGSDHRPVERNA